MAPLSIDMMDGSIANIDPTQDPNGYAMALGQRAHNRHLADMLSGRLPVNTTYNAMWAPFWEAFGVHEENDPRGRRVTLDPSGFGFDNSQADMDLQTARQNAEGPFGRFGAGTGGRAEDLLRPSMSSFYSTPAVRRGLPAKGRR